VIGCRFVRDVRFFPEPVDAPPNWARSIVQGKSYNLADPAVTDYFAVLLMRLLGVEIEVDRCHRDLQDISKLYLNYGR
jgi:putative restriction endonuclease